jgi:hypothetical protein
MKYFLLFLVTVTVFWVNNSFSQNTGNIKSDSVVKNNKHQPDIPLDSGFYIYSKDEKSYLQIYGSVRLNGAYDINGLQSQSTFSTYDIPTGDNNIDKRFYMAPYQTRFGFGSHLKTSLGNFNLKLECDFFGSGENAFRIRHAYGTGYNFLLGQTWSLFGDPGSIPVTVDPDGPNSSLSERTIQIRYQPAVAKISWAVAIESPKPDVSTPDSTQLEPVYQSFPDITSLVKLKTQRGYFQLSGVFRSISVRNFDESVGTLAGYGGFFSGKFDFTKKITIFFQFTIGKGISRYIAGLKGNGQDVIYDEQNKTNVLLGTYGGYICGSINWNKKISSNITFGLLDIFNKDFQPDDSFKRSFYFSLNTFLIVVKSSRIGIEYDLGKRLDKDGSSGTANRISFIGIMDF